MLTPDQKTLASLLKKRMARASKNVVGANGVITQDTGYFITKELIVIAEILADNLELSAPDAAAFLARAGTAATRQLIRAE